METPSLGNVRFGAYEVRPVTRELFVHGRRVKLPPQAFEVLRVLLERKGELVTRQEFHRVLWPADTFVDFDQGLNNAIKRIREVLRDSAESPRYIETLPRLGYRFIGELGREVSETNQTSVAVDVAEEPETADEQRVEEAPRVRTRRYSAYVWALAMGIGVLVVAWLFRPRYSEPKITGEVQLTSDGLLKPGPLVTDGLRIYFNEIVGGKEAIVAVPTGGGQAVPLKLPLDAVLMDISPDKRDLLVAESKFGYEDAPLWRVPIIGGTPRRLGNIKGHDATLSPDGKMLAYTSGSGVYLANADGSDPRTLRAPTGVADEWAWRPIWSPDSEVIRFTYYEMETHGSHEWEMHADGSHAHLLFAASADLPMQAAGYWTQDGRYYIFSSWKSVESGLPWPASNLWAIREKADLFHRKATLPSELTTGPIRFFFNILSTDDKTIYALSSLKHGELMRYDSQTKSFSPYASGISAEGVSYSRDGKWMAYVKYPQGELWRSRVDGSEPLQLSFLPMFASTPSWSPDGKQIAFNGFLVGQESRSYLVSADGGEPRSIEKIGEGCDPNWKPDGSSLVYMDNDHDHGGIRILNLRTGNVEFVRGSQTLIVPRVSPDGRWIAALSEHLKSLLVFDTEKQTWRELVQGVNIQWPRWSSDSRSIYFERGQEAREIVRISVAGGKPEVVLNLKDIRTTGEGAEWFSLTPRGDLLLLRDTGGGTEIYALSWDAP